MGYCHGMQKGWVSLMRLYNLTSWRRQRRIFLQLNPLCIVCQDLGMVVGSTVVDHIIPHRGNLSLFFDQDNWQALCKAHHDKFKKIKENQGIEIGCSLDGTPLDPGHHWNVGGDKKLKLD